MTLIRVVSIAGSLAILLFVVQLIRRRKLRERYALLWLLMGGVLLLFSVWQRLIDILAGFVGIYDAPNFLFLVFFVILALICLHLTVVISRLGERTRSLTQELAHLRNRLEERSGS